MPGKAFVAGVGMVAFGKPGASDTYDVMAAAAVRKALDNAGLSYDAIQQAIVGYVYGDSTSGQRALYEVGMTGIPIANVNNNCSTGSTALFLARQLVESGAVDCILALGFEQMQPGALSGQWTDRPSPFSRFDQLCDEIAPYDVPIALRYFGGAGKEYMERYGVKPNLFAKVRAKASRHAAHNPLALFRRVVSEEEVMAAPMVFPEAGMTRLMACPPTCGAAAAILVSRRCADRMNLDRRVFIAAQAMTTRGSRCRRTARLLRAERGAHLRGAGPVSGRRCREVRRRWRQHLRRPHRDQSVGGSAVEGAPAGGHRPRPVHGTGPAVARRSG